MSCPFHPKKPDPYAEPRRREGILVKDFRGTPMPMLLRHEDVRRAAKDWHTFSSDAPFKVSIPSEEDVRTVRQLPLEVNPPLHQEYRAIAEPFFDRAKLPEVVVEVENLIRGLLERALASDTIEIVREFALPLQSRALACLLNVPRAEAEIWIEWGGNVFRDVDGTNKGAALEAYIHGLLDRATAAPGPDFFSALVQAEFQGRPLTRAEMLGFCSLVFAGGRDTVINSISSVIGHLSFNPSDFAFLREDPKRIIGASEEFFRVLSPVTHLARVCPAGATVHGMKIEPGGLIALNFAAANYDPEVFDSPDQVRLDRRPNPHVAFGFGPHLCLGAAHARLVVRSLIKILCERVERMEILDEACESGAEFSDQRHQNYDRLKVRFIARASSASPT
jgi:cytochrome P450